MSPVRDRVVEFITVVLDQEEIEASGIEITDDTYLTTGEGGRTGLGMDSMAVLDLITSVEEEYDIDLDSLDVHLMTIRTVRDLVTLVERAISESPKVLHDA